MLLLLLFLCIFEIGSLDQARLELSIIILLPQPLDYWPPCPVPLPPVCPPFYPNVIGFNLNVIGGVYGVCVMYVWYVWYV